jgi:acylphosphatase
MTSSASITRASVHYSGHVQGVGFRYTVLQIAKGYEVAGFVENLPDGRVLLEAEGSAREVGEFLGAVVERMSGYIVKTDRNDVSANRKHQGFAIR